MNHFKNICIYAFIETKEKQTFENELDKQL